MSFLNARLLCNRIVNFYMCDNMENHAICLVKTLTLHSINNVLSRLVCVLYLNVYLCFGDTEYRRMIGSMIHPNYVPH